MSARPSIFDHSPPIHPLRGHHCHAPTQVWKGRRPRVGGAETRYSYDPTAADGRLKRTTLPTVTGQTQGRAVEIAQYDGQGRPTKINALAADGSVRDSVRFYDELGQLTREVGPPVSATDPNRPVTCVVYTPLGDVKEIWAGSSTDTTSRTCTLDGITIKRQLSRTFDDFGRPLTEIDALGNTWTWTWNRHHELVSSQTPAQAQAGQSTTYAYGAAGVSGEVRGHLKTRSVPGAAGQRVVYTRNPLGQVTRVETWNGAGGLVNATATAYDAAHRPASVTDSRGLKTLAYTWTPGGRLAQVQGSDGHVASFAYDAVGRLASLTAPNGETVAFVWDAGGRLIEQRLHAGQRTTQRWFEDGNLKQRQTLFNTSTLSSHLYSLDPQGRRAGQTELIGGTTKTWSYLYDSGAPGRRPGAQSYWGFASDWVGHNAGLLTEIGVGFTPAGVAVDVYGSVAGRTPLTGEPLSGWERAAVLIPGVSERRRPVASWGQDSSLAHKLLQAPTHQVESLVMQRQQPRS